MDTNNNSNSNNSSSMFPIDSEAFLLNRTDDELVVPKLGFREIMHQRSSLFQQQPAITTMLPSSQAQQVGVFGVDANKRINLWNDSAASVTGALLLKSSSSTKRCPAKEEDGHPHKDNGNKDKGNKDNTDDCNGNVETVVGMPFGDLFPSSLFEVSLIGQRTTTTTTRPVSMPVESISMANVLDKVLATGIPSMAVPVIATAGRKRGRGEMTVVRSFSVDFLPQFAASRASSPPLERDCNSTNTNSTNTNSSSKGNTSWLSMVSGVVLVCRTHTNPSLIDIARSVAKPSVDKLRSMSAGSAGTCPTETETETEVGNFDKEEPIDDAAAIVVEVAEIDNSFHTCQIDSSFRIDDSFRTCQIDHSIKNVQIVSSTNRRLAALEAFEGSDDSDGADSDDDGLDFPNLRLPPLTTTSKRDSTTGTRTTDDTDEDYRTLFETIDTIIFGVDLFGNINEWNHKMEELTGISKDDAMGRSLLEDTSLPLLPFPDPSRRMPRSEIISLRGEVEPVLSNAYRGQSCPELNLKLKSTSTSTIVTSLGQPQTRAMLRHLTASVSPRYDTQQQVVGALFLGTDLTKGFTRFMGLQTDAHELRKLIDTANAPIFGIDAHGYVSFIIHLLTCLHNVGSEALYISKSNTAIHQPVLYYAMRINNVPQIHQ